MFIYLFVCLFTVFVFVLGGGGHRAMADANANWGHNDLAAGILFCVM